MTSNGRWPQNIKSEISQQPLIGSYTNFKLKYDQTILCKPLKWRRPSMEDDLKILKVKYLSNHLLDPTQILNLCFDEQTMFYKYSKWRRPPMEENLKILKVEHLSNHLLYPTQILNVCLDDQTILYKSLNEDNLQWMKTSKY
jgi:hypothetical protein